MRGLKEIEQFESEVKNMNRLTAIDIGGKEKAISKEILELLSKKNLTYSECEKILVITKNEIKNCRFYHQVYC